MLKTLRDFRPIDPRSVRITLVEAGLRILSAFCEPMSSYAECSLWRLRVNVQLNARVAARDADGVNIISNDGQANRVRTLHGLV